MSDLLIFNARIVTPIADGSPEPKRGREAMRDLQVIPNGFITITDGLISNVGAMDDLYAPEQLEADNAYDAEGGVLLPGFVDCHTHACWAGERLDEFQMKLEGADYLSVLKAGGGIMSTAFSAWSAPWVCGKSRSASASSEAG